MPEEKVLLLGATRTPFGRFQGALSSIDAPLLAARTIDHLIRSMQLDAATIDAVFAGVGMIGGAVLTPARRAVLYSEELSDKTPSTAIDRACCSGMTAVASARRSIRSGDAQAVIAGGFDVLSNTPRLLSRKAQRLGNQALEDPLLLRTPFEGGSIAAYTSQEALKHGVDRTAQDEWAQRSHETYFAAQHAGFFEHERFALNWTDLDIALDADEAPRATSDPERLAILKTVNDSSTITAGNAPGLSDGAAFLLLGTQAYAEKHGLNVLAEIMDHAELCGGPMSGTSTPARCIDRLLTNNALEASALDLIEINEAFAATPIVSALHLTGHDQSHADTLLERTNVHGGAVAIGHPLGASGARITMTLAYALRQRGGGIGAAAICGGYGQGEGLLLRVG